MDRKTYIRDIYSKYWITAREEIYGFSKYDKNLCEYICGNTVKTGKLLEVAIGTGYPFANFFQKSGYSVYGIDISPDLIKKCKQLNPAINCKVGDAENLEYPGNYFNCTYCFHSSWYLPDLNKAVDEMFRVTQPGGIVMFDIQNRDNETIDTNYRNQLLNCHSGSRKFFIYAKNILKVILRQGIPVWHIFVHEVPTYPEDIYEHFKMRRITHFKIMVRKKDGCLEGYTVPGDFKDYERLVFVAKKT